MQYATDQPCLLKTPSRVLLLNCVYQGHRAVCVGLVDKKKNHMNYQFYTNNLTLFIYRLFSTEECGELNLQKSRCLLNPWVDFSKQL